MLLLSVLVLSILGLLSRAAVGPKSDARHIVSEFARTLQGRVFRHKRVDTIRQCGSPAQLTCRPSPAQKGLRNSVFSTLPAPDSGKASARKLIERGHL